jgi:hypothetical protein
MSLGSEIRDREPEKIYPIPGPDPRVKKAPDPGSAALSLTTETAVHDAHKGTVA